jgi:hypothetical protein
MQAQFCTSGTSEKSALHIEQLGKKQTMILRRQGSPALLEWGGRGIIMYLFAWSIIFDTFEARK